MRLIITTINTTCISGERGNVSVCVRAGAGLSKYVSVCVCVDECLQTYIPNQVCRELLTKNHCTLQLNTFISKELLTASIGSVVRST